MTATTLGVLIEARRLIAEVGWTTGAPARDKNDVACSSIDSGAVSFCAIGAIHRAAAGDDVRDWSLAFGAELALGAAVDGATDRFNDAAGRTRGEVLAAFDEAIQSYQTVPA